MVVGIITSLENIACFIEMFQDYPFRLSIISNSHFYLLS